MTTVFEWQQKACDFNSYLLHGSEFLLELPLLSLSFGQGLLLLPSLLLQDGDARWGAKPRVSLCLFNLRLLKSGAELQRVYGTM